MTKKAAETTAPAEKAPVVKDEQHGVTRPKAGTKTGRIWEISDYLSQQEGKPVARKKVLEAAMAEDINAATAATQYGRWRKYHGLGAEPKAVAEVAAVETSSDVTTEADAQ
jgi:hypothetical protein